jgi:hypothetical protein
VFKGEIIAGLNLAQVDGDWCVGYNKPGAHLGAGVMFPFSFQKNREIKPWAVSMEILFNQRGARRRNYSQGDDPSLAIAKVKMEYLLKLDYVSLPLMIHYNDRDRWMIAAGFGYNRLIKQHETEYDIVQTHDTVALLRPNDFTVLADVRVRIWQQLKFGFRFEYSMFSLRERYFIGTYTRKEGIRKQYNHSLTFYFVYMLNEKKTDYKRKKQSVEDKIYYY